jgi:hypothetical protein
MLPRVAITDAVDVKDLLSITAEYLPGLWIIGARDHHAVQNEGMRAGELAFPFGMGKLQAGHGILEGLEEG